MREQRRGLKLLLGTAFRTGRWLMVSTLLEPLGRLVNPLFAILVGLLLDAAIRGDARAATVAIVAILASQAVFWVVTFLGSDLRITLSEKVGFAFDHEIARLSATLPGLDHHERADYQDRLELLRQNQGVLGGSMNSLVNTANALIGAVGALVAVAYLNPLLLGLALFAIPGPLVAVWNQRWQKAAEEQSAAPSRLARHLRRLAYDRDAGMEIRVFGLREEIASRVRGSWLASRRPALLAARRGALANGARDVIFSVGLGGAILFMLWQATRGEATVGAVVATVVLCQQVQMYVLWPVMELARFGTSLRAAGRLLWLQDYAAAQRAPLARREAGRPLPGRLASGIVFDNVSFCYPGSGRWVLRNLSLTIPAGSVTALVGENGAGKTTLVKLLTRMYEPTEGRILVDGIDLADLDVERWRARLSAAFQDFARLEFAARENVGVGDLPRRDDEAAVFAALDRAGAADVVPTLPDGTATQLGASWEGGVDLSTGQWQKLALGRALMRANPLLVFFDEPTASLDAPTEHALFERYADAARSGSAYGMVTVLVSHRFSTVSGADLIVVLDGARVAESGSHEELIRRDGLYADLYSLQANGYR
ncbi:ABC transporter ATP-binding protein [Actinopolymorpha alba]|uniref:ABC transporter ATP-binding protein n=1 Tax=Actinopolymorpha alba TaxID=533267 RepID=UPI00036133DB|nr:ABC transporter ATP-binding protein [Actinopolymorpha alba]